MNSIPKWSAVNKKACKRKKKKRWKCQKQTKKQIQSISSFVLYDSVLNSVLYDRRCRTQYRVRDILYKDWSERKPELCKPEL